MSRVAGGARLLAGSVVIASLLAGCSPAGQAEAGAAASRFQRSVAAADWAGACGLLSERAGTDLESAAARPCPAALPALQLPTNDVGTVEVWGHNAKAMVGQEAVFLSRFSSGWRVIAAGCTPRGEDLPYQCAVGS